MPTEDDQSHTPRATKAADVADEVLTEAEAAERMRWSRRKVQRLRLSGKLPYFKGYPPTILLSDLMALRIRRVPATVDAPASTKPDTAPDPHEEARKRARLMWLKKRFRASAKSRARD
ncbi:hypothetical protein [Reyranella sp.]|uniref:hypothetical protein n=1 Tax=Reyranella sp. TaxID=1929291 RepID=UPI003C7A19AB